MIDLLRRLKQLDSRDNREYQFTVTIMIDLLRRLKQHSAKEGVLIDESHNYDWSSKEIETGIMNRDDYSVPKVTIMIDLLRRLKLSVTR